MESLEESASDDSRHFSQRSISASRKPTKVCQSESIRYGWTKNLNWSNRQGVSSWVGNGQRRLNNCANPCWRWSHLPTRPALAQESRSLGIWIQNHAGEGRRVAAVIHYYEKVLGTISRCRMRWLAASARGRAEPVAGLGILQSRTQLQKPPANRCKTFRPNFHGSGMKEETHGTRRIGEYTRPQFSVSLSMTNMQC